MVSFRKLQKVYQRFWIKENPKPPYSHVCQIGDPVLRLPAQSVDPSDISTPKIKNIIKQLKTVLQSYECVGLAAPQIGISYKICVTEFTEKHVKDFNPNIFKERQMEVYPFKVFINPEMKILDYATESYPEMCASVNGLCAHVPRYKEVLITGLNENGEEVKWEVKGWPARIIQHEMDHLKGRLFTDIMDKLTLECTCWNSVNVHGGLIQLPFIRYDNSFKHSIEKGINFVKRLKSSS